MKNFQFLSILFFVFISQNIYAQFIVEKIDNDNCSNVPSGIIYVQSYNEDPFDLYVTYENGSGTGYFDVAGDITLANLPAGTYNLSCSDELFSLDTNIVILSVDDEISIFSPGNISCYGACDASIFVNVSFLASTSCNVFCYQDTISSSSLIGVESLDIDASSFQLSDLCAGTYYFVIDVPDTDCEYIEQYTLLSPVPLSSALIDYTPATCSNDGQISTLIVGGVQPYTTSLFLNNNLIGSDVSSSELIEFDSLTAGIYYMTIEDSYNCFYSTEVGVLQEDCFNNCGQFSTNLNENTEIQALDCSNGDTVYFDLGQYINTENYYIIASNTNSNIVEQWNQEVFYFSSSFIQQIDNVYQNFLVLDQFQNICDSIELNLLNVYCDFSCQDAIEMNIQDIYCSYQTDIDDDSSFGLYEFGYVNIFLNNAYLNQPVIIEIENLATQNVYGTVLDSSDNFFQELPVGAYSMSAYFIEEDCYYSEQFSIVDYSMIFNYYLTPSSGLNNNDATIDINVSSGTPFYTVEVQGPNNFFEVLSCDQGCQLSLDSLFSGVYNFVVHDESNCSEYFEVYVNYIPSIYGCTDQSALNYNPQATEDDGSCDYCNLSLVEVINSNCLFTDGYIEVSTNQSNYDLELQILENNQWVSYFDGCLEYLDGGASWSCLPADTFMVIGYGWNNCIDTLNFGTINLTSLIESEQIDMIEVPQLTDDSYTGVIPMGFDFVYNGVTYNECLISSNNYVSFDLENANSYSGWAIGSPVPSTFLPQNAIMAPYQDLNPMLGGSIEYLTYGTAPERVFVVRWKEVPMFFCSEEIYSSTVYLYEGTNIIETHIENKPSCPEWNSGAAIHALHSSDGTQASVVFDNNLNEFRNYPLLWSAVNDAYQFIPSQNSNAYTINNISYGSQIVTGEFLMTVIEEQFGCTDELAINYNPQAVCSDNSCIYPIAQGCTDSLAFNYDPEAEQNDGSCCYTNPITIVVNTGLEPAQSSWDISELNGDQFFESPAQTLNESFVDSAQTTFLCLQNGCYQINLNYWIEGSIQVFYYDVELLNVTPAVGSNQTTLQFCVPVSLVGCTNPQACNYDEYATEDDGSCAYSSYQQQEIVVCDFIEYNGILYTESFSTIDTLISSQGCDSLINTFYQIQESPQVDMLVDFIDNSLTAQTELSSSMYSFYWNNGMTTNTISLDTNGNYVVMVNSLDFECFTTSSIYVSWLEDDPTNIELNNLNNWVQAFPNPSKGIFYLSLKDSYMSDNVYVSVINAYGQKIIETSWRQSTEDILKLDLSSKPAGMYLLRIGSKENYSVLKLLLQ